MMSIVERPKYVCYCIVNDGVYMYDLISTQLKHYFNFKNFTYPGFYNDIRGVLTFTNDLLIIYTLAGIYYIRINIKTDTLLEIIKTIRTYDTWQLYSTEYSTLFVPEKIFRYNYVFKYRYEEYKEYKKYETLLIGEEKTLSRDEIDKINLIHSNISFDFTRISKYKFGFLNIDINKNIIAVSLEYNVQILKNNNPIWTDYKISSQNSESEYKEIRNVILLDIPDLDKLDYKNYFDITKEWIDNRHIRKIIMEYI
jgi:hypothetical protein